MSKQIIISSIFFRPPTPAESCLRSCFAVSVFYGLSDAGEMFMFSLVHCIMFFFAFVLFRNFMPSVDYSSNVYWHGYGLLGELIKSNKSISQERKASAKEAHVARIQFTFTCYSLTTSREMENRGSFPPTGSRHVASLFEYENGVYSLHESQHSLDFNLSTVRSVSMMFHFLCKNVPLCGQHIRRKNVLIFLSCTQCCSKAFSVGEDK